MDRERKRVLVLVSVSVAAVAVLVLGRVLGTVTIAIAAGYILLPIHQRFIGWGISDYWSAILASIAGAAISLVIAFPFVFTLYARRQQLLDTLTSLDTSIPIELAGRTLVLDLTPIQTAITPRVSEIAVFLGRRVSVLSAKFIVYAFVVFALLYYHRDLRSLAFGPLPTAYHDVADAIHGRIRATLFGHYVLVLIGGATTYVAGVVVFTVLGYAAPYTLALAGAVIWILPFVSAAPLVLVLSAAHALDGDLAMAVFVGVLGAVFLVMIPTAVVSAARTRFGNPQRLSKTVYFVGFVGGGLTLGIIGLIVGPLALTVLVTLAERLAAEQDRIE